MESSFESVLGLRLRPSPNQPIFLLVLISLEKGREGERRGEKGREGERRGEKGREGERRGEKGLIAQAFSPGTSS